MVATRGALERMTAIAATDVDERRGLGQLERRLDEIGLAMRLTRRHERQRAQIIFVEDFLEPRLGAAAAALERSGLLGSNDRGWGSGLGCGGRRRWWRRQ